eukprot:CAMPEP_0173235196 /NCGR_PEP_ID=MMETSP1142-20121109/10695_1 /TAXON_ID=483371 /ORGANISM="non described non described, Strain CCMP2298" /LENGTH=150 /DNA_ID=CAMNT_0014165417 /DNA_START=88 /DNA_END=540 /DNA_ORIENTATION=-
MFLADRGHRQVLLDVLEHDLQPQRLHCAVDFPEPVPIHGARVRLDLLLEIRPQRLLLRELPKRPPLHAHHPLLRTGRDPLQVQVGDHLAQALLQPGRHAEGEPLVELEPDVHGLVRQDGTHQVPRQPVQHQHLTVTGQKWEGEKTVKAVV